MKMAGDKKNIKKKLAGKPLAKTSAGKAHGVKGSKAVVGKPKPASKKKAGSPAKAAKTIQEKKKKSQPVKSVAAKTSPVAAKSTHKTKKTPLKAGKQGAKPAATLGADKKKVLGGGQNGQIVGTKSGASHGKKGGEAPDRNPSLILCLRCFQPFEPLEKERLCPNCNELAKQRFWQLFGDEDPYSPQPTIRTSKIARVIPRKLPASEAAETAEVTEPVEAE